MELNKRDSKPLDFTVNGRAVSTRKLGFGDAFGILADGGTITQEEAARIIIKCLIYTDTGEKVYSDDDLEEVLSKDADAMTSLFNQVCSFALTTVKEAEKN